MTLKTNEVSSWTNYPDNYKFMSLEFELNLDVKHVDRTSYDILDMCGDTGGFMSILMVMGTVIAAPFVKVRIQAIITNRLSHMPVTSMEEIFGKQQLSD